MQDALLKDGPLTQSSKASSTPPEWYPSHPPLYDIEKSYLDNLEQGPFFNAPLPQRILPPKEKWIDFLGHAVASPLGVPAGPLLGSKWISLAAQLGFDIPIYKTIRSHQHPAHPLPNMIFVQTQGPIFFQRPPRIAAKRVLQPAEQIESLAVTNSFGMPSMSPSFLLEDIARANHSLKEGQVMVVSVVGTPRSDISFIDDFVSAALLAKEAGAQIIEANFSCPNVDKKEGSLYMSASAVQELSSVLVQAIHPLPLIIKVGLFVSSTQMQEVMVAAARSGVRAISGINTVSMRVVDESGESALGAERLTSGICGGPIRNVALHFVELAAAINQKEKLGLTLIGVGGITRPEHFDLFFEKGADVAMSATGMMWDPYLAMRYHHGQSRENPS